MKPQLPLEVVEQASRGHLAGYANSGKLVALGQEMRANDAIPMRRIGHEVPVVRSCQPSYAKLSEP